MSIRGNMKLRDGESLYALRSTLSLFGVLFYNVGMVVWQFHMFGAPVLVRDGVVQRFESRKALALLAYLAMQEGRPVARETLCALLWPDADERRAKSSLRYTLSITRKEIDGELLETDRQTVALRTDLMGCDVVRFRRLAGGAEVEGWQTAVELYTSDFLAEFSLKDSDPFEVWRREERESWRLAYGRLLEKLIAHFEGVRQPTAALIYAERWLQLDKLHEPAHRALMRLYGMSGQRAMALQQYEVCRALLDEELGVDPDEPTRALHQQILQEAVPQVTQEMPDWSVVVGGMEKEAEPADLPPVMVTDVLPPVPFGFLGRTQELRELQMMLKRHRLITVLGIGGLGKTALVTQFGHQIVGDFADGVYFVPLAPLSAPDEVAAIVGETMGVSFDEGRDPAVQLQALLENREVVLILDNLEHLLGTCTVPDLLSRLLDAASRLRIVATSRERLRLRQEAIYSLDGLNRADDDVARQLFVQTAQQIQPYFEPDEADNARINEICHLVQGLPLGIRLAAGLVNLMSLDDLLDEIGRNADVLTSDLHDVQDRHRSIRAVFHSSWERLPDMSRLLLSRLSVCQGAFDLAVAKGVAQADVRTMNELVSTSLVQRSETAEQQERYLLHPLIRQYAAEQLDATEEGEAQYKTHAFYFTKRLRQLLQNWDETYDESVLEEISVGSEDMRAAWRWHLQQNNPTAEAVDSLVRQLSRFYGLRGRHPEVIRLCEDTLRRLPATAETGMPQAEWMRLMARSHFALGQNTLARQKSYAALALLKQPLPSNSPRKLLRQVGWGMTRILLGRGRLVTGDEIGNVNTAALIYQMLTLSHYFDNNDVKVGFAAVNCYLAARRLPPDGPALVMATALMYGMWRYLRRHRLAERYFDRAVGLIGRCDDLSQIGLAGASLAAWHLGHRPWHEVKEGYELAIRDLRRSRNMRNRHDTQTGVTYLYLMHGEWDLFLQGNRLVYQGGLVGENYEHIGWSTVGRVMFAQLRRNWVQAEILFKELMGLMTDHELSPMTRAMGYSHFAHYYTEQQDWERALAMAAKADSVMRETEYISFAIVGAYTALSQTRLRLYEWALGVGSADVAVYRAQAEDIVARFRRFTKVQPVGEVALAHVEGGMAYLDGREKRAVEIWRAGVVLAKKNRLVFDEYQLRQTRLLLSGDGEGDGARIAEIEGELVGLQVSW